ncbi:MULTISPECIES: class I SAM-dependent methyltransferase [Spirulina sp. CCY15215]|uniref:class I SAM-dependent methyltransferase n=1 Tax=Spirulina sp. CCY15215 TaxID=2767591 RepID=UPI0019521ED5
MRKDYSIISEQQITVKEEEWVEQFWSQRWDSVAQLPDANSIAYREEYQLIAPWLQQLPSGSKILDGGCGLGEWTIFLGDRGFEVVGFDISQSTITRLQEIFDDRQFVHGDIRQTDFENDTFDAYFSWGTFEHFENGLGDCIREAYRILKPGGFLFISVPYQNWRHILRDSRALFHWDETYNPEQGYTGVRRFYQWRLTIPELERELAIERFKVLRIHPIGREQGIKRMLIHDLPIQPETWLDRLVSPILSTLIPTRFVGHMILAIAQKKNKLK